MKRAISSTALVIFLILSFQWMAADTALSQDAAKAEAASPTKPAVLKEGTKVEAKPTEKAGVSQTAPDAAKPEEKTGAVKEATSEEHTELASQEEHQSFLEAQRRAIAQEREALYALREQVNSEIDKLMTLQKKIDERFAKEDQKQEEKIKKLVKIYSTMRPDEVGPLLSKMDEDLAVRLLSNMKPKSQADLLARMPPDKAAEISKKLIAKDF